jgi:hypothetical protein
MSLVDLDFGPDEQQEQPRADSWQAQSRSLLDEAAGTAQSSSGDEDAAPSRRATEEDTIIVDLSEFRDQEPSSVGRRSGSKQTAEERWSDQRRTRLENEPERKSAKTRKGSSPAAAGAGKRTKPSARRRTLAPRDPNLPLSWAERLYQEHTRQMDEERARQAAAENDRPGQSGSVEPENFGFGRTKNKSFGENVSAPPTTGFAPRGGDQVDKNMSRRTRQARVLDNHFDGSGGDAFASARSDDASAPLISGSTAAGGGLPNPRDEDPVCECVII